MKKLIVASFLTALCVLAYADTIHLVDGKKLEGKIIKETDDMIVLDTGREKIPIQKEVIRKIERDSPAPKPKPKPKPAEEEKQELSEEQRKEADAIKKVHKKWMSDRKKIRCKKCKGHGKLICPACKGTGKYVLREPYSGRIIRSEKCKYCDGNKLIICPKCRNGLSPKYAEKVFWTILSPERKKALEKELGSKEQFLEWLYKAYHGEVGKHKDLAGKIQFIDHNKYVSFEILKYEFNEDLTEATVSVRLKKSLSQKKEDRIVEHLRWVKDGDKWYLDPIGK